MYVTKSAVEKIIILAIIDKYYKKMLVKMK